MATTVTTTTGGFAKVHSTTASGGPLDKAWLSSLDEGCSAVRQTFRSGKTQSYAYRMSQLQAMLNLCQEKEKIMQAMGEDLKRPEFECENFERLILISELKMVMKNLKSWMKPEYVGTPPLLSLGSSRVERVPKGVVLVIGAWNFPFVLSLGPCIAALAAGNCVVLKPSEVSPKCAQLVKELCEKYMDPACFRVVLGEVKESTELLARKWDHIFYTGNAVIGRVVMTAAAKHLCPVTLELGGKSPVIVDRDLSGSQLQAAVNRILHCGLFVNAGQICVSPDYVLVHEEAEEELLKVLKATVKAMQADGKNLGKVVNSRHFARLKNIIESSKGEILCGGTAEADSSSCFLPPTIISKPELESPAMTEELFGPVLCVRSVKSLDEAIDFVNSREAPLALYIFSSNYRRAEEVVRKTRSGGVAINDTGLHLANMNLPFGGVGESGFGCYHGKWGFDELSHKRSIYAHSLLLDVDRYPPYTSFKTALVSAVLILPECIKDILARLTLMIGY